MTRPFMLGAAIPSPGGYPIGPGPVARAQVAEAAGADSLWVNDHLAQVDGAASRYPFSADGKPTWAWDLPHWESLTTLAFLAAGTRRCTIGTAVLVLPQRNVIQLAKTAATLDVLSGGRLTLGVGIGWLAEEMQALGYAFRTRGRRADEMLEALRRCWSIRPAAFAGEHVTLPAGLVLSPPPAQRAGPPLLVGGMGDAGLRRAARAGDGWLALTSVGDFDEPALAAAVVRVAELRAEGPRAEEPFRMAVHLHAADGEAPELPGLAVRLAEMGFDEVIVDPPWSEVDRAAQCIHDIVNARGKVA